MAISQRKFREIVFQVIFSQDFGGGMDSKMFASFLDQFMITKKRLRQVFDKAREVIAKKEVIDDLITKFSKDYDVSRISCVERNVLRLGVFEVLFDDEISPKIAISESIRLSRKFGTPEGGAFVNAVLDAIYLVETNHVD